MPEDVHSAASLLQKVVHQKMYTVFFPGKAEVVFEKRQFPANASGSRPPLLGSRPTC